LRRTTLAVALLVVLGGLAHAEVRFSGLDLAGTNDLLFQATVDVPEYQQYGTLFNADLGSESLSQLTFFPEHIALLPETGQLQIQNRFGVFRTTADFDKPAPIPNFPSFVSGRQVDAGKIALIKASPDGRFLLYEEPEGIAYANLMLADLKTGKETVVSRKIAYSLSGPPVTWSPKSNFFIYGKGSKLYYFSIEQYLGDRLLGEEYRSIGEGVIESVKWGTNNELYYVSGSLVYRILGVEFFTRSFYRDLLATGTIVGKIPFTFDPNFDSFWISPDGGKILLDKGGRNIFLYVLQNDDFLTTGESVSLPYLFLPRNTRVSRVLWSEDDTITLLTGSIRNGETENGLYRIVLRLGQSEYRYTRLDDPKVRDVVISPDGTRVAELLSDSVVIRDYGSWNVIRRLSHPDPLHALWVDGDTLVVAGRYYTELREISDGSSRLVGLSQAESYGYEEGSGDIIARVRGSAYRYNPDQGQWQTTSAFNTAPPSVASSDYRVYLESMNSGSYNNMVMVRNAKNVGTFPLFLPPERTYEPFPDSSEPVSFRNFTHGSRIRRREVAFVFNAVDSVEGLTTILNTLSDYGITATFFVNGDFIRRHPGAVQEIADSGHEVGSLFYTYFDMTDSRYQISRDFITQGLARNEDEYFQTTGKELSLIWHAPYYFVSPEIIAASREMNYTYVGRDVDSLDWVPRRDGDGLSRLYAPATDLVARVVEEKKPGSIISMTVGVPGDDSPYGGRDDYLFQHLDLLINRLLERGYQMVPISDLIEHAK